MTVDSDAVTSTVRISDFVLGLPKCEMHLHLDGTLEPSMKLDLARRNNIEIPQSTTAQIRESFRFHDLPTFLAVHYSNMNVLWTSRDYEDLAYSYLQISAQQNVRHTEMFFDPQLHTSRGVPFPDIVNGYRRAIVRARIDFGMSAELIMCFLRDYTAEYAMATLMEALPYKDWIIGVGLDSDELDHPPAEFSEVFARARSEGFLVTMHCDVDQVDSAEHIRQAIADLHSNRIDHGLNVLDDPDLVIAAREKGLGFTVCPLGYGTHPCGMAPELERIHAMLEAGLKVSVGSDDPPYFGGYLAENLQACIDVGGFTEAELVTISRNAFETAWVSERRRVELLEELDDYARRHGLPA
ncbi:adenosine deaminase [Williamsia sp.]|uniref:adenosine deaminase n=1 Tax=Williamsia sp. TaxID=1872085 RepID=UPI002F951053